MEGILLLAALIGFVIFSFVGKRSRGNKPGPKHPPPQKITEKPLRRFDAKNAESLPHKPIVQGPVYVVDGDTVVIQKTQIRLFGVDAPEMNHPYGKKAK